MTQNEITERKNQLYPEKTNLESLLDEDDYKIIKCAEAMIVGEPMPYDAAALHAKHQQWRARVNEIEEELKYLNSLEPEEEQMKSEE